ncbi:hypothetical protein C8Q80DRAFT_1156099 [Daedaleopsis nitida]|nr:hypothetical protein C8Q80DRAFT_1156099 [Daedaleopsis nitida]
MGQRHQAFLIARVRPHGAPPDHPGNRRCVAAFHHQWCYGSLPLKAMYRLATLVSQPENAAVIRAELHALDGKYGAAAAAYPCIPDVPCPYTASLLGVAWTTDLGPERFCSGTTLQNALLHAGMSCWGGDNNDGISVMDITDPEKPAYCFMRNENDYPLDARGYLRHYYSANDIDAGAVDAAHDSDEKQDDDTEKDKEGNRHLFLAVSNLANVPLITANGLREAWPEERFRGARKSSSSAISPPLAYDDAGLPLTLGASVKHAINDDADAAELERLIWLPGKACQVLNILRDVSPFTEGAIRLLARALSELKTTYVDLPGFQLTGPQVVALLSNVDDVESLNLSSDPLVVADDVLDIIATAPTLRRLNLMDCREVSGERLVELVMTQPARFRTVEGILHPAILTINKPDPYPCAFTYSTMENRQIACIALPFFSAAQVVQGAIYVIPWRDGMTTDVMMMSMGLSLLGWAAFHSSTRKHGQMIGERTVVSVPKSTPLVPRMQTEMWMFVFHLPYFCMSPSTESKWGFVHYTSEQGDKADGRVKDPKLGYWAKLYDLQGFLDCMKREGRPVPSDEAVQTLQGLLSEKDSKTGQCYCRFMEPEDVTEIEPPSAQIYAALALQAGQSVRLRACVLHVLHMDPTLCECTSPTRTCKVSADVAPESRVLKRVVVSM